MEGRVHTYLEPVKTVAPWILQAEAPWLCTYCDARHSWLSLGFTQQQHLQLVVSWLANSPPSFLRYVYSQCQGHMLPVLRLSQSSSPASLQRGAWRWSWLMLGVRLPQQQPAIRMIWPTGRCGEQLATWQSMIRCYNPWPWIDCFWTWLVERTH